MVQPVNARRKSMDKQGTNEARGPGRLSTRKVIRSKKATAAEIRDALSVNAHNERVARTSNRLAEKALR